MKGANFVKRKIELFMIMSYVLSGLYIGKAIRNLIFISISNIWVSLLFLSPLILSGMALFTYKKNKHKNIPLMVSSLFWIILAASELFDDVSRSNLSLLFSSYMTLISMAYLLFLAYLSMREKKENKKFINKPSV